MKYTIVMALSVLALTACEKDNYRDKLQLIAEGYSNGTKVSVDGLASSWVDKDHVWINGAEYTISADGSSAYVSASPQNFVSPFRGVYPYSIVSASDGNSVTLTLPESYTYSTTGSQQELASPMVAYSENSGTLFFKHVTGAIGVQVKNYHDYAITVDQIQVTSNVYKLNGEVTVALGNEINIAACTTNVASERTVTMNFGTPLTIAAGETKTIQIPVLPVGTENKFTVTVQISNPTSSVTATLTRTQATKAAMVRAGIGYAYYTIGGPFSVSSTKKVVFSKGNLQYNAALDGGTWRFAPNQYDVIGADNENIADNYDGYIDLFGWGTGNAPTKHTTTVSDYSSFTDWGTAASEDIGTGWYTLTKDEWAYVTTGDRVNKTTNLPYEGSDKNQDAAKFVKATINVSGSSYAGIVIFPDQYIHPENVTMGAYKQTKYNSAYATYTQFVVNDGWEKMELAGAVFLPQTGYRNGTTIDQTTTYAYYWSSTQASTSAYSLYFTSTGLNAANSWTNAEAYKGHATRLVRDVN